MAVEGCAHVAERVSPGTREGEQGWTLGLEFSCLAKELPDLPTGSA
jgi:hypothetical protein